MDSENRHLKRSRKQQEEEQAALMGQDPFQTNQNGKGDDE